MKGWRVRTWVLWLPVFVGCYAVVFAGLSDASLWFKVPTFTCGLVTVFVSGATLGLRRAREEFNRLFGIMPKRVTFHCDDDGVRHALVEQANGNVRTIEIPEEIDDPHEAADYIFMQLEEDE